MNYKIINDKILYQGFYSLHKISFKHKKHDGSWSKEVNTEVFSGAHAATVLPYDPIKKKIVLIDQFRIGVLKKNENPYLTEIVAGIIDKDETPEKAAIRECKEETDCNILKLTKIFSYFPAPGSSFSYYHLFLGEVKSFEGIRIKGQNNENEDILSKCYSYEEVKKMINQNKINNGLTLIALQWFFLKLNELN